MKIHHLGVVTTDLAATLDALGLSRDDIVEVVEDENQKNRLHFIHVEENDLWLELVEPMDAGSSIITFARRNRVGLHHLAFSGHDLPVMKKTLAAKPRLFPLGSYQIDVKSFGGNIRTLFVAFHGLLLEYVENIRK